MKIALPIVLVACGVIFVTMLLSHQHWQKRTYADSQADFDKISQVESEWLEKHPELKAKDEELQKSAQATDATRRQAMTDNATAQNLYDDYRLKIRDEVIKEHPSMQDAYDRQRLDRMIPYRDGDQELSTEFGAQASPILFYLMLFLRIFPALALGVGVTLLFRPLSRAGAHLFLIFILIPLACGSAFTLRFVMMSFAMRYGGLWDGPTMPQMLLEYHHLLMWDYLYYIPSLLLYILLLFRIHFREQKTKYNTAS